MGKTEALERTGRQQCCVRCDLNKNQDKNATCCQHASHVHLKQIEYVVSVISTKKNKFQTDLNKLQHLLINDGFLLNDPEFRVKRATVRPLIPNDFRIKYTFICIGKLQKNVGNQNRQFHFFALLPAE